MYERLRENVSAVRERINTAARRSGRDPSEITLVIVTKTVTADTVRALIEIGETQFGENRIQPALPKIAEIGPGPEWHMIGTLQRNKVRKALESFSFLHAVDSVKLAFAVNRVAGETGKIVPVFLEVNVAKEETKHGFDASDVLPALEEMSELESIDIRGFMTMAPYSDEPEDSREHFAALRKLRDRARNETGLALPGLSMGMSGDYEVAVEEGATHLRIGTAFFDGIE